MIRGLLEALVALLVFGMVVAFIASLLGGCTLVFVRGNDNALDQVGGHNGWQVTPATHDTPSLRERIFGAAPDTPKRSPDAPDARP